MMQNEFGALPDRFVHLFFVDGVGLGGGDPAVNPFVSAETPHLDALFKRPDWYLADNGPISAARATLVATDANLAMPGRPQSATGQAAILTGRNVPQLVGEHYGPKPNRAVSAEIQKGTLFHEVISAGGQAALITPYPQGFFDAIQSGKRLLSSVPLSAHSAGIPLMTADDLRLGRAVSPDFTGQGWRDMLGYSDMPLYTLTEAGRQIGTIAPRYQFSFFEHWPSDRAGHRGTLAAAAAHLSRIDTVVGGLVDRWDDERGLLIITSDHGNIEEKDHRLHTRNPVPTIVLGRDHATYAAHIQDLTDIATVIRHYLRLPAVTNHSI